LPSIKTVQYKQEEEEEEEEGGGGGGGCYGQAE